MQRKWLWAFAAVLVSVPAQAQIPDTFKNLQVLPKDTSKAELTSTMRHFAFALGVRCEYCHVENADKKFDYAADDKQEKKTARVMLQMVAAINHDYINKLVDSHASQAAPVRVECVTCHHGLTVPRTLNSVLAETIDTQRIDRAVAQYTDLRRKYDGTGAYDFGETTLNQLTESLLAQHKNKEAAAIMEMSFTANHPDSIWSYHMLAMAHQANGQTDKAIADYRAVLELHPDDTWAKQQIDALSRPQQ